MKAVVLLRMLNEVCDLAVSYWEQTDPSEDNTEQRIADEISEIRAFRDFLTPHFKHSIRVEKNRDMMRSELLSPKQAASFLQCSERHVYQLIKRGELEIFRDGITRIFVSSLQKYVEKHSFKHDERSYARRKKC